MAKYQKKEETKEQAAASFNVEVTSAKIIDMGKVNFNITVNGVNIYGMHLIEYKNANGEEKTMISFPQWKSNRTDENGKPIWYPYVAFRITKELQADIEAQIDKHLNR